MLDKSIDGTQRRVFLKRLSHAVGMTMAVAMVNGTNLGSALAYQPNPSSAQRAGAVFDQPQMLTLMHIAKVILPRTDSPSGADVDCHGFTDHQLHQCYDEGAQFAAVSIINDINQYCNSQYNRPFSDISQAKQVEVLQRVEQMESFNELHKYSFKLVKSLIVFGFFTSEVGASQVLRYDPVPGGFKVIPYKPGDKSWGSSAYY